MVVAASVAYADAMSAASETLVLAIPRAVVAELPSLSKDLSHRMHALLERNTEGTLGAAEREGLETLVQMAQLAQILVMAVQGAGGDVEALASHVHVQVREGGDSARSSSPSEVEPTDI
jgi:hypothetical protein